LEVKIVTLNKKIFDNPDEAMNHEKKRVDNVNLEIRQLG
jgi:hypothetical protein